MFWVKGLGLSVSGQGFTVDALGMRVLGGGGGLGNREKGFRD